MISAGSENHQNVTSIDYFPTIASLAGIDAPAHDGIDISATLRSNTPLPERPIFWHYPHYGNQGGSPGSAIRLGDWKLIEFFEDDAVELYNLKSDIGEQNDVAQKRPEIRDNLLKRLNEWRTDVGARFPTRK